jgi:hypothetical protein
MYRWIFPAIFLMATTIWAQDPAPADESATEAATEAVEGLSEEQLEDLDIDSQEDHTEDDEGVFKPTDVVSFTQPVPFPVDI